MLLFYTSDIPHFMTRREGRPKIHQWLHRSKCLVPRHVYSKRSCVRDEFVPLICRVYGAVLLVSVCKSSLHELKEPRRTSISEEH